MIVPSGDGLPTRRPHPLIDHLVAGRECGDCAVCCKVMQINEPDFVKPRGVYCEHCTAKGCGIHATRPDVCRTWFCLWRRIAVMPEATRPDKIGIVFAVEMYHPPRTPFERMYIVGRAVDDPAVFDTLHGQAALNMFIREGSLPVFTSFNGEKRLLYPDRDLADAILDPVNTVHRTLVPAALEFRKKYAMT